MLHELCYDQDLYILQTALIIFNPNLIFVSTMDRFQLLHFFKGSVVHTSYNSQQLLSMVKKFLYVLITHLTHKLLGNTHILPPYLKLATAPPAETMLIMPSQMHQAHNVTTQQQCGHVASPTEYSQVYVCTLFGIDDLPHFMSTYLHKVST
jgi:hypothetical protein